VQYDGHSELLKVAPRRLDDALELLEPPSREPQRSDAHGRHLTAAYYLAGYAVECVLKVYVILLLDSRRPRDRVERWSQVVEMAPGLAPSVNLAGKHSHNLHKLLALSQLEPYLDTDGNMKAQWGICAKWDYNVRYGQSLDGLERDAVSDFVAACGAVYRWVRARLPFRLP